MASLSVSTDIGSYPLYVLFNASGSTDDDGSIVKYAWSFGDGSTGSGSKLTHTYRSEGSYTVTLTITDNSGLTATTFHLIEVKGKFSISGYVNQKRRGSFGKSFDSGDTDDYFIATLTAGMGITLYMAENPSKADLSLYLYDSDENYGGGEYDRPELQYRPHCQFT